MSRFCRLCAGATRRIVAASVAAFALACGPEVDDEDEDDPPGVLEYEHPQSRIYRLDRRVDVVPVDPEYSTRECGFLTDRAYDDLLTTLAALEPSVDYDAGLSCPNEPYDAYTPKDAWIHLEGFEHSPFACDWRCCPAALSPILLVYIVAENNFDGIEPVVDEVPYVAIEPGRACE